MVSPYFIRIFFKATLILLLAVLQVSAGPVTAGNYSASSTVSQVSAALDTPKKNTPAQGTRRARPIPTNDLVIFNTKSADLGRSSKFLNRENTFGIYIGTSGCSVAAEDGSGKPLTVDIKKFRNKQAGSDIASVAHLSVDVRAALWEKICRKQFMRRSELLEAVMVELQANQKKYDFSQTTLQLQRWESLKKSFRYDVKAMKILAKEAQQAQEEEEAANILLGMKNQA